VPPREELSSCAGQNAARAALRRILTYQNYSFVKSAHRTPVGFFTPLVGTQPDEASSLDFN
jgi:hypothetical protein